MKFQKTVLQDALWDDIDNIKTVSDEITGTGRWTIVHDWVFEFCGKFYRTSYTVGATEMQDERPFEYDGDEIECHEVKPVEKTIVVYEPA
mgnify:CR=1 FL=1